MKKCSKCQMEFPETEEYFYFNRYGEKLILRPHCKNCHNVESKKWRELNREKNIAYLKEYYEKNKDVVNEKKKEYHNKHRERLNALHREWYYDNHDYVLKRVREWKVLNSEKVHNNVRQRKIKLKYGEIGTHSAEDVKLKIKQQKHRCYWCNRKIKEGKYHEDHLFPLSRNGKNNSGNIVISCPECNLRKGRKMPWEFCGRLL